MTSPKPGSQPPSRAAHRTDLLSLFFGLLFLVVVLWWAAAHYLDWNIAWDLDLPNAGWLLAGGLILLGVLGIVASLRRDRVASAPANGTVGHGPDHHHPDEPVTAPTPGGSPAVRPDDPEPFPTEDEPGAPRTD
jgi:hypothetical protein